MLAAFGWRRLGHHRRSNLHVLAGSVGKAEVAYVIVMEVDHLRPLPSK
jgi:hypothetical protein